MKGQKVSSSANGKEVQEKTDFGTPNYPNLMSERTLEVLRVFFMIPQLILFYFFIKIYGIEKHFWYFTSWSLDLVYISIAFTIYLGRFKDK